MKIQFYENESIENLNNYKTEASQFIFFVLFLVPFYSKNNDRENNNSIETASNI